MDPILQAVQRAKISQPTATPTPISPVPVSPTVSGPAIAPQIGAKAAPLPAEDKATWLREVELDWDHLERRRIVAHNVSDIRCRAYDILRTQVLQSMDRKRFQVLAVTSPTEGCGKSVTAINLALSIARQPERSVVLVDLDLQRPQVSRYLGFKCEQGVVGILSGKSKLKDAAVQAQIGGYSWTVVPAENRNLHSSELIASRAMRSMLQDIKDRFPGSIVILDLPPVLSGDDVLSVSPYVDCFLLVAAVGRTTVSDVRECNKHLHSAEILRVVLNKSSEQQLYYGPRSERA